MPYVRPGLNPGSNASGKEIRSPFSGQGKDAENPRHGPSSVTACPYQRKIKCLP
ncbi:SSU ribosomal protein S15p (S13e) [Caballeronia sordidicola]|uniref:SSU ribosomal protein S15p (S13e) n=1 Tax=Caballeronia sordidicola TaxID=196367 RepID=A0A242MQT5_CABSO|nr:SSU ribosomal protein S15p (S13e) [Caballeronia sordidicola]